MFVVNARAHLSGDHNDAPLYGKLLTLPKNIRLGWKRRYVIQHNETQHNNTSVVMLIVIMLSVVMLNVRYKPFMLSVIIINVVMLGVVGAVGKSLPPTNTLAYYENLKNTDVDFFNGRLGQRYKTFLSVIYEFS
jgi:hypothetical protein